MCSATVLPNIAQRLYDSTSSATTGVWSRSALAFVSSSSYFLSYQIPSTAPIGVSAISTTFRVCAYAAAPLTLNTPSPATIQRNEWTLVCLLLELEPARSC
jgi:hypothetical protein